ncbi:hypothetical protein B0T13DRAFT_198951 [Neurospora crassa]|nr:hypothetical protein B0T13DRAFT_198951 [Neurospora crassa]
MQRSGAITIAVTSPIHLFLSILLGGNRTHLYHHYVPNHSAAAIGPFPNLPSAFRDERPATHPFHAQTITCSSRRSRAAVPHQASKHRGTRIECMDAFLACTTLLAAAGELASHDTGRHDTQTYTPSTTWRDNGKTVAKMELGTANHPMSFSPNSLCWPDRDRQCRHGRITHQHDRHSPNTMTNKKVHHTSYP